MALGIDIIGVGFAQPEVNEAWGQQQEYDFELWTDDNRELVDAYGAMADFDPDAPLRHAYLIDADGSALLFYEGGISLGPSAADVLEDCQRLYDR